MDSDGYPEKRELMKITKWPIQGRQDCIALLDYVKERWKYADCGFWRRSRRRYRIATGGWSGNESIIDALSENVVFWMICWRLSQRGGLYIFELPRARKRKKDK